MSDMLEKVHPELARRVKIVIENAAKRGFDIKVVQGLRTIKEQNELYAQGRTKKGRIVTKAPGGFSPHNYGCAVDLALTEPVREGAIMTHFPDRSFVWAVIGDEGQKQGLEWGGSWKSFKDRPHLEVPLLKYGRPLLKLVSASGSLVKVWKEVDKVFNLGTEAAKMSEAVNNDKSESWVYTVKPGDSLSLIAKKYLGSAGRWAEIELLNDLARGGQPYTLAIGAELKMPKR